MQSSHTTIKAMVLVLFLALLLSLWAYSRAAEHTREYEITVPPYRSDMVRMVEAYERLSDQYLTLVGQHLTSMDANDRMILQKLETLEKKIDALTRQIEQISAPKAAPLPSQAQP